MPVITVEAASLDMEQKRRLASELTDVAARILGMPEETIYVFLKENPLENIGVGGRLLSEMKKSASPDKGPDRQGCGQ